MEKINGILNTDTVAFADFKSHDGEVVSIKGYIHRVREMTGFSFVIIRTARDTIQAGRATRALKQNNKKRAGENLLFCF